MFKLVCLHGQEKVDEEDDIPYVFVSNEHALKIIRDHYRYLCRSLKIIVGANISGSSYKTILDELEEITFWMVDQSHTSNPLQQLLFETRKNSKCMSWGREYYHNSWGCFSVYVWIDRKACRTEGGLCWWCF